MFFGFLRVDEVTAIPHKVSVPWCRIKPCKLRLAFRSHKYSVDFPFNLDFLPTERTPCPCRRMVNYIKLGGGGHGQITLFCYANKLPVQKTAFAKYLEAVIVHTDLVEKNISPHCCRIGAVTWQPSQVSLPNRLKPWDTGILTAIGSISRLSQYLAKHPLVTPDYTQVWLVFYVCTDLRSVRQSI